MLILRTLKQRFKTLTAIYVPCQAQRTSSTCFINFELYYDFTQDWQARKQLAFKACRSMPETT